MQSNDDADELDDIAPDFLNAVANAPGRAQALLPRRPLGPAQGTPSRLTALGLGRRTPSVLNVPRSGSLLFRTPDAVMPPDAHAPTLIENSAESLPVTPLPPPPPPPPPPSLEEAFMPLPARPVLPHTLHFQPGALPADFATLPLPQLYEVLGDLLAARDCALNHATFWLLDVLLEALLYAQRAQLLTAQGQCALVEWYGFLLVALREHAWSREQLFAHLESAMVASVRTSASCGWRVPSPDQPVPLEDTAVELAEGDAIVADAVVVVNAVIAGAVVADAESGSEKVGDEGEFDPVAAVAELAVIAKLLYATFCDGFAHAVQESAFCAPQDPATCPLERQLLFPKTLRPAPPPPKKEKKPPKEGKSEKGGKGKSGKGGKSDKSGKGGKSDKSGKGGKSDKSGKGGKGGKSGKSDKSEKGDKKGSKKGGKGKKGKKVEEVEEVVELPPPPENPLAKYRVEEVEWSLLEETARLNKECVCRLQEACPESFFTELFPPKPKKEPKEEKEKKGKDKGGKGKDKGGKGGKGKDKGGKGKGKKK